MKESLSPYLKLKRKIELGIRNQIEGKFGQGKNAYELNRVRTRTTKTSESWIACIIFIMNLIKFDQEFLQSIFEVRKNRGPGYIVRGAAVFLFALIL